jgi:hypothetical protein
MTMQISTVLFMESVAPVSVEANLRSRLCRSQNRSASNADSLYRIFGAEANLRSRLHRSQNRRIQKGLPV